MKKIWIGILVIVAIALFYLFSVYLNFAIFDFQCKSAGCGACSANPLEYGIERLCEWSLYSSCNKDCKVRNFKCGFDSEFYQNCRICVDNCMSVKGEFTENCTSCYK